MLNIIKIACVFLFISVTIGAIIYGVLSAFETEKLIVYIFSPQDSPNGVDASLSNQTSSARSSGFITGFFNFLTFNRCLDLRANGNSTQSLAYWFLYHQFISKLLSYMICGLYYTICILLVFTSYKLIRYWISKTIYLVRKATNERYS